MQLLTLHAYAGGFRGCVVDAREYRFFQFRRKGGLQILKSYPKTDFSDLYHFVAMMQKFMTPSAIMIPPIEISELTLEQLEQAAARIKK
jgi:hypothetical protein